MKIGIAGAGLMGRLVAWHAVMRGWDVTLFDCDTGLGENSCGLVAAGLLTPGAELIQAAPPIWAWGLRSIALWPTVLKTLTAPVFWQQQGSVIVSHAQDKKELERLTKILQQKISAAEQPLVCDAKKITSLEPALADRFAHALYFPQDAQLATTELFFSLQKTLQEKNVNWHTHTLVKKTRPHHIETDEKTFSFDWVFDCRGLGAKSQWPELRGVRGELIVVQTTEVTLHRPVRLLHPRYPIYISPKPNHEYVIGATNIESDDRSPISVQSMVELLSAAFSVHPGFAEARILHTFTQCRPALPDNLPQIKMHPGLIQLNGLYRDGYLVGPALIEDIFTCNLFV